MWSKNKFCLILFKFKIWSAREWYLLECLWLEHNLAIVTDATLTPNQDYYWTGGPGRSSGITTFSWSSGDLQFKSRRWQPTYYASFTMVTPWRDLATQHCKWSTQLYAASTQPSLLPSHLQQPLLPSFPPSPSPFLLSRWSPFSHLPIRAVDPSLRGGEVCDGCNLNSKPRLLLNCTVQKLKRGNLIWACLICMRHIL